MRLFGGAFFVEKSCCFILPKEFRARIYEDSDFDVRLSALLYHLTLSEGILTYIFIYDEYAEFPADRILDGIRRYVPDLSRVLVFPAGGESGFSFRFLADNRFERRRAVPSVLFDDREMLYRSLIDECAISIFCLDTRGGDPLERRAAGYASSAGKRMIDLAQTDNIADWF